MIRQFELIGEVWSTTLHRVTSWISAAIVCIHIPISRLALGVACCALPLFGSAQSFQGHQIGETTEDFLKVEPELQKLLIECQNSIPRRLTDEEVKKNFGKKAVVELHRRMMQDPNIGIMDKDQDVFYDKCGAMLTLSSKGEGIIDGKGYDRVNSFHYNLVKRAEAGESLQTMQPLRDLRDFSFGNGRLTAIRISVVAADYKEVRDDVSKRLGTLPAETSLPYHNVYGATWNDPFAAWDTGTLHVELDADDNPASPRPPELRVQTQEAHQRGLAYERQKKSPLDPP